MQSARDILLDLDIPEDDPLRQPKKAISACAPGVRLIDRGNGLNWESDYVWIICVNEEDGLEFKLLQTTDGSRELSATWNDEDLVDSTRLKSFLQKSPLWDVFELRAVSLIQDRVEQQLTILLESENEQGKYESYDTNVRPGIRALATKLKAMEYDLLERFYEHFEEEVRVIVARIRAYGITGIDLV